MPVNPTIVMLKEVIRFILNKLSAGNFFQNIGFYTLILLIAWVVLVQFKQRSERYRIN